VFHLPWGNTLVILAGDVAFNKFLNFPALSHPEVLIEFLSGQGQRLKQGGTRPVKTFFDRRTYWGGDRR
jgi:hypothetical protein